MDINQMKIIYLLQAIIILKEGVEIDNQMEGNCNFWNIILNIFPGEEIN